nr:MAG TPA: hypothetical protein [Caudoviricetes sp.]
MFAYFSLLLIMRTTWPKGGASHLGTPYTGGHV